MTSFLYPCSNGCGRQVRFMRPQTEPVVCDDCVEAIAANKRSTREARRVAREAARQEKRRATKRRRGKKGRPA